MKTHEENGLKLSMRVVSKPGATLEVKTAEIPRAIQEAITKGLEYGKAVASKAKDNDGKK